VASLVGGVVFPPIASAGIDVSGLPVEGVKGNPSLASQLKAYDGSGSARVREIKSMTNSDTAITTSTGATISKGPPTVLDDQSPIATWAYRQNPGAGATLSRVGALGNLYRYRDNLAAPANSKLRSIGVQFEFPADWLPLDRQNGGIQYVDQRNGDKLYVFRATLPENRTDLITLPKSWIGDAIFSPNGSFAQSGQMVEDYSVSRAQVLSEDCPRGMCAPHRRFQLKFSTVTGNGLRVERRGLVDVYQVENTLYMIMASSNAIKFDQKDSRERETVEGIVSSFQIDV
jgi:hypothetical protein